MRNALDLDLADLGGYNWVMELPPYLLTGCIEVTIKETSVGSGAVIPELRYNIW